jgi:hypothetical protein
VKLATPDPYDLTDVDLREYKGIIPPWNDWRAVETQCRSIALEMLKKAPTSRALPEGTDGPRGAT